MAWNSFLCIGTHALRLSNPFVILPEQCLAPLTVKRVIIEMVLEDGGHGFAHSSKVLFFLMDNSHVTLHPFTIGTCCFAQTLW
jgi:hypothetical protein